MKTTFWIKGCSGFASPFAYETGCSTETLYEPDYEMRLSAPNLEELLKEICSYFRCTHEDITLDACEEPGRIDVQVLQREAFKKAKVSNKTRRAWEHPETNLWLTDYCMYVTIEHTGVPLSQLPAGITLI